MRALTLSSLVFVLACADVPIDPNEPDADRASPDAAADVDGPLAPSRPDAAPDRVIDAGPHLVADAARPVEPDAAPDPVEEVCGEPGPVEPVWRIEHAGRERRFHVHLPAGYDATPTPVVLNFHGRGVSAENQALLSEMRPAADAHGFIAVHPVRATADATWNAGLCCGAAMSEGVDDVGFTAALIDALADRLCVDLDWVYATGLSNGGFMAHRLGCELADRIAAVAGVAGPLALLECRPVRPVSVLHFHGTADPIVPYDGFAGFVGVPATLDIWRARNGCDEMSTVAYALDEVRCEAWACRDQTEVQLCRIEGGGHTWPGGFPVPFLGETTDAIDATEWMWGFFEAHPRR